MDKLIKLNKKAQVNALIIQVLSFVGLIIMLVIGAIIVASLQTSNTIIATDSRVNMSFTFVGNTSTFASGATPAGFGAFIVNSVNNGTNFTFASNNYEVNSSLGIVRLLQGIAGSPAAQNAILNVSATWQYLNQNSAYNASSNGITGINNISGEQGLIGLILVFVLVLTLVFGLFGAFGGFGSNVGVGGGR